MATLSRASSTMPSKFQVGSKSSDGWWQCCAIQYPHAGDRLLAQAQPIVAAVPEEIGAEGERDDAEVVEHRAGGEGRLAASR